MPSQSWSLSSTLECHLRKLTYVTIPLHKGTAGAKPGVGEPRLEGCRRSGAHGMDEKAMIICRPGKVGEGDKQVAERPYFEGGPVSFEHAAGDREKISNMDPQRHVGFVLVTGE